MSIAEKLTAVAENQQRVYDAGYSAGQQAGGGSDSYYDTFWDTYQQNGERSESYSYAFSGRGWTDALFNPKYPLTGFIIDQANYMFADSSISDISHLERMKIRSSANYTFFRNEAITHIGEIEFYNKSISVNGFANGAFNLVTIDKLVLADGIKLANDMFQNCRKLTNITIEGTVDSNINFQWCTLLSKASIENVISVLYKDAVSKTVTFSRAAVNKAFETSEGANDGSTNESSRWFELVAQKPDGWTYALNG